MKNAHNKSIQSAQYIGILPNQFSVCCEKLEKIKIADFEANH